MLPLRNRTQDMDLRGPIQKKNSSDSNQDYS